MNTNARKATRFLGRRDFLRIGGSVGAYSVLDGRPFLAAAETNSTHESVRDRLWLWGHYEGSHNKNWGLPAPSRITPIEAAYYMGTPNVVMVGYEGKPALPWEQYAIPFRGLRQVVWSAVAAGGDTNEQDRDAVFKLAEENPNITGFQMDDFFRSGFKPALSIDQLKQLHSKLKSGSKKLDLWVTLYTHDMNEPVAGHLQYVDVITLWTSKAADLTYLNANMEKLEKLMPSKRIVLGCYMWDYGTKQPMPVSSMQQQCELGIKWLQQGRIEGMIFLASCICDLNLEAVEWTRSWIQKVGGQRLAAHHTDTSGGIAGAIPCRFFR